MDLSGAGDRNTSDSSTLPRTEIANRQYRGLDVWPSVDVLKALLEAQRGALDAVEPALPALAEAAEAIALRIKSGGRLIYVGAGSSGLLAQVDALELPGTYGFSADQLKVIIAGGESALTEIIGSAEDDADAAIDAMIALALTSRDSVVAISASGKTPFAVAALTFAKQKSCLCIGMANNAGTKLLTVADHAILMETPPEVVAGSTRMNAGTAQKCALNMLSTLIGVRLGRVYDGLMVNMQISNDKLHGRAVQIISQAAGVHAVVAESALQFAGNDLTLAILVAAGTADVAQAKSILKNHDGNLRAALAAIGAGQGRAQIAPKC